MGLLPDAESYALIAMPEKVDSLSSAIGEAHRRYSRMINFREG
jgi:putative transposase